MPFVGVLFSTWICQYITLYGMGDHKFVSRKIGRPLSFQVVIWLERQHWRSMTLISSSLKPAWSSAPCRWTTYTFPLLTVWRWLKRLSKINHHWLFYLDIKHKFPLDYLLPQYRVGAFGFFYQGSDEAPGNMGLYDQVINESNSFQFFYCFIFFVKFVKGLVCYLGF